MENVVIHDTIIEHADGAHNLEIELDGDQAVIRFGSSFTLRMSETQIDKLREILHDTARCLCIHRRDTTGVFSEVDEISLEDLHAAGEIMQSSELEMVQAGIDARAKKNSLARETFNPNDPVNW